MVLAVFEIWLLINVCLGKLDALVFDVASPHPLDHGNFLVLVEAISIVCEDCFTDS